MSIEVALSKLRSAQICHPNAVQFLIDEAITAIQQAEAQQPATGAGDIKSKAWAWDGVCNALNEHWPQWSARPTNGAACATLAIADMAKAASTHPAPGVPDDVVRDADRLDWLARNPVDALDVFGKSRPDEARFIRATIDAAMLTAAEWVGSVSRHPDGKPTDHQGG